MKVTNSLISLHFSIEGGNSFNLKLRFLILLISVHRVVESSNTDLISSIDCWISAPRCVLSLRSSSIFFKGVSNTLFFFNILLTFRIFELRFCRLFEITCSSSNTSLFR